MTKPPLSCYTLLTAHLDVDSILGFLAVEQAFDVKVWAPCVFVNWRSNPLSLAGDDHIGIYSCGGKAHVIKLHKVILEVSTNSPYARMLFLNTELSTGSSLT